MYFKLDYGRVYEIIRENLDDMRAFCGEVIRLS